MSRGVMHSAEGLHVEGAATGESMRRVVFAGSPNCGKTTLFNRLTGLRAKTANYPGTTVEVRRAVRRVDKLEVEFVDLPGLYGLCGDSPEETVAARFLTEDSSEGTAKTLVVLVIDATRLGRQLSLVREVRERVGELVVALNMTDLAEREGITCDIATLTNELGAPVIPLSARTGAGVRDLEQRIADWRRRDCPKGALCPPAFARCDSCGECPYRVRFRWAEDLDRRVTRRDAVHARGFWTGRVDRWATHPWAGLGVFAVVMAGLFQVLFHLAEYPMEWIDAGFGHLRTYVGGVLPEGYVSGFIVDGLLTGVGGMVMFLPQICLLFFLLSLLEDTGYLARAAFVADRWMAKVGLPGKAFLPILSAHACAIPAVMSARTIEEPRDRLAATFVLPLFTCSARIPVYVMVTAMLFAHAPAAAGAVFAGAYFLGILAAFCTALVLKRSLLRGEANPLVIELPTYKVPSFRTALLTMVDRGGVFLKKAGTLIIVVLSVLWGLTQVPVLPDTGAELVAVTSPAGERAASGDTGEAGVEEARAKRQLEYSVVGRAGRLLEPVFAPLGFDWKITIAVLTSFAAREVVVSTLSVLYGLDEAGDAPVRIGDLLATSLSPAAGLSLLVFFVLSMQCLPTQIVVRRETGTWKWPLLQFVYMSLLAYTAALVTFQLASRIVG